MAGHNLRIAMVIRSLLAKYPVPTRRDSRSIPSRRDATREVSRPGATRLAKYPVPARARRLGRLAQLLGFGQRLQLLERAVLDLADALARDVERAADLLERARAPADDARSASR